MFSRRAHNLKRSRQRGVAFPGRFTAAAAAPPVRDVVRRYLSQMDRLITLNLGRAFWALLAYAPALLGSLVCTTRAVRVVEAKQRGGTKEL